MLKHVLWHKRKRLGVVTGSAGSFLIVMAFWIGIGTKGGDTCEHAVITRVVSPDGAWEAVVDEATCEVGLGGADITAGVQLVSTRDPTKVGDVLGVDTGGHTEERPRILWTAPNTLQVVVPNLSSPNVLTREFAGVRIDLRFDPDDSAARAAWQHELDRISDEARKN